MPDLDPELLDVARERRAVRRAVRILAVDLLLVIVIVAASFFFIGYGVGSR